MIGERLAAGDHDGCHNQIDAQTRSCARPDIVNEPEEGSPWGRRDMIGPPPTARRLEAVPIGGIYAISARALRTH